MKKSKFKRSISLLLAFIICLSTFTGLGITVSAAGVKGKSYMVSFPRENDAKADYSGTWGHGDLSYMNGWSGHTTKYTTFLPLMKTVERFVIVLNPVRLRKTVMNLLKKMKYCVNSVAGATCHHGRRK